MDKQQRKILIIGPSWVGDMVMAQSLFMVLQQRGEVLIDVLAPGWSRPLLARMPQVRRAIELPIRHGELALVKRYRLGGELRQEGYDQAIVLPNSLKSALIPLLAGIPQRTGWRGEMRGWLLNDCRILDKEGLPLMVQRFVALGLPAAAVSGPARSELLAPHACPRPALQCEPQSVKQTLAELGVQAAENRLVLCPGAEFGDSKQWPASHFAGLASQALDAGWQVLVVGSANDAPIAEEIAGQLTSASGQQCLNLTGRTSLGQVIDVLSTAQAVLSNDSGLMHIAAALQRPLVAVYGSTSPAFTPPLADRVKLLASDIACRPCFARQCPLGHKRCLTELTPAMAWRDLQEVIRLPSPTECN